jgi:hypothetical protein
MTDIEKEIDNAKQVVSNLSRDAKAAGDLPTMYKANQAWHALQDAGSDLYKRRLAVSNGDR